ncbi:hypothetical protein [Bdellovibrio sp. HCB288]|uniref:hypothetical protein n=1 Tax=Bdellovibrio sp. HCB288 TaxID=3394355 RepID=UPI0039B3F46F
MNSKKLLKVLAIGAGSVVVVFGILGVWLLSMLPGPSKMKEAVHSSISKIERKNDGSSPNSENSPHVSEVDDVQTKQEIAPSGDAAPSQTAGKSKMNMDVVFNDFANPEVPLASACQELSKAGESGFFPKNTDRTAVKFMDNIVSSQKDPVLESVAPIMRWALRVPGISDVVQMVKDSNGDDSLVQKAELYRQLYRAANYFQNHSEEANQVIQKSYNLHMLSKAVALKPQLASDSSTLSFCEQIQGSLLSNQKLNVEEQVQEMQKFLQDAGIDEKAIGFDANYRAKMQMDLGKGHLSITDSWLEDLFKKGLM